MGWGSATSLFDSAVDVALLFIPTVNDSHASIMVEAVVEAMYTRVDWDDWDTQGESKFYDPYLRDCMVRLGEIEE